ncbi:hypothetical protein FKB34_13370 [Glycocaulis profundi]|nr:hypothetical protein FKB34_13370 [Glycocaulis profundi]
MLRAALLAASGAILLAACEPAPEPADTPPQQAPAGDTATDPAAQPADPAAQPPADPMDDPMAGDPAMDMDADACGATEYQAWIGTNVADIDEADLPEPNRVYVEGDAVTMDHRPDRLNIVTDADGNIVEVSCG